MKSSLLVLLLSFLGFALADDILGAYVDTGFFGTYWYFAYFPPSSPNVGDDNSLYIGSLHAGYGEMAMSSGVMNNQSQYIFFEGSAKNPDGVQYMHIISPQTKTDQTIKVNHPGELMATFFTTQFGIIGFWGNQSSTTVTQISSSGQANVVLKVLPFIFTTYIYGWDQSTQTAYLFNQAGQIVEFNVNTLQVKTIDVGMEMVALAAGNGKLYGLGAPQSNPSNFCLATIDQPTGKLSNIVPIGAYNEQFYKNGISAFNPKTNTLYTVYGGDLVSITTSNSQMTKTQVTGIWAQALFNLQWAQL